MSYIFEVRRLVPVPVTDHSALAGMLGEADEEGWELVSTFESYYSFQTDTGRCEAGIYLTGIFRTPKESVEELMREFKLMMGSSFYAEEKSPEKTYEEIHVRLSPQPIGSTGSDEEKEDKAR